MTFSSLIKRALFFISVPKCVSCGEYLSPNDTALCPKCYAEFQEIKSRNCSLCSKKLSECSCSNDYLKGHFIKRVVKVFRYVNRDENLPANSLIYSLKRYDRADVQNLCASELSRAIKKSIATPSDLIITHVPRRKREILRYGLDHSATLARKVATDLGAEYKSLLVSHSKQPQKKMRGEERRYNVKFEIKTELDLSGKRVVIVDDVITTGTSMGTSAALIKSLGAKEIIAASLSIAYKDEYVKMR